MTVYKRKAMGYVYILSNKHRQILYIGVTADLKQRVYQHRNQEGSKFTTKYNVHHLVYYEEYQRMIDAIEREKQLKKWKRAWKLKLIKDMNPQMRDLWPDLAEI